MTGVVCHKPFSAGMRPCCVRNVAAVARASKSGKTAEARVPLELAAFTAVASLTAGPAYADVDVDSAVSATVGAVQKAGAFLKSGVAAADKAASFVGEKYQAVSPRLNELVDQARPLVKRGVDEFGKVAGPAASDFQAKQLPSLTEQGKNLLKQGGVDVDSLSRSAGDAEKQLQGAATTATPTVNKVVNFLTTADPQTLGKTAIAAVAIYYLSPVLLRTLVSSFRGYGGDINPARAVDIVGSDGNATFIDIRTSREKEAVGVPDVPSSAKGRFVELEMASVDRRLRGQLRNVDAVEAQVTALEIQALKRVNKGTRVLLLDKNGGGQAKNVAKELNKLGFRKIFIVTGGFSGWSSSKLQVRKPNVRPVGPGSTFSNIIGTISTRK